MPKEPRVEFIERFEALADSFSLAAATMRSGEILEGKESLFFLYLKESINHLRGLHDFLTEDGRLDLSMPVSFDDRIKKYLAAENNFLVGDLLKRTKEDLFKIEAAIADYEITKGEPPNDAKADKTVPRAKES